MKVLQETKTIRESIDALSPSNALAGLSHERVAKLCEMIIENDRDVLWNILTRKASITPAAIHFLAQQCPHYRPDEIRTLYLRSGITENDKCDVSVLYN